MSEADRLKRQMKDLERNTKFLSLKLRGVASGEQLIEPFDVKELELIRRIISSVLTQMRSDQDINTAKRILRKTTWLEGGEDV